MSTSKYIISVLSAILLPTAAYAQDAAPVVEYLYNNSHTAYFRVEPSATTEPEVLSLELYNNVREFSRIAEINLLDNPAQYAVEGMEDIYAFPISVGSEDVIVHKLTYKYADASQVVGRLTEGNDEFVYMTDLPGCNPLPNDCFGVGWGNRYYDVAYNGGDNNPLKTSQYTYAKGYGAHGGGYVQTPASLDISEFSRFCVDVGGQPISNPTRCNMAFKLYYDGRLCLNTGTVNWQNVGKWDFPLEEPARGKIVKVEFPVISTNTNYVICIGAPRFYYAGSVDREEQAVVFDGPGGPILGESQTVSATATAGTPIIYSIVEGADLATLEGNELRPIYGKKGTVVVEALTLGNGNYMPASARQEYTFNMAPDVRYLGSEKNPDDEDTQLIYLYVEPQDKALEKLTLDIYDNVRSFQLVKSMDLVQEGLEAYKVPNMENVYAIPVAVSGDDKIVHRLTYKFSGEDEVAGRLCEGNEPFVYMTDLPRGPIQVGWSVPYYDVAYNGVNPLRTQKYTYAKGYGVHAGGYVETPSTLDLSQFSRFCADVGGQPIDNVRGRLGFALYNGVSQPYLNTGNVSWENVYEWDFALQSTAAGKTVKLTFTDGGDGNMNDIVCIGAPRFYYNYTDGRVAQTIDWVDEEIINIYKEFSMPLTATASSGLPVVYRITRGAEYARLSDANTLTFYNIPSEGSVVVEAYQPGNKNYEASDKRSCTFRLRRSLIVPADKRMELEGGSVIDELVVSADANSAGQVVVKDGIVQVKKLVLKYTFVPGEWNYVAFPSDLDLNAVSDLGAKGFVCATEEGTAGTYILREYNSRQRSEQPMESAWVSIPTGKVQAKKGYIMKLESAGTDPVEITFNMDNVALDLDNEMRTINLAVDLSKAEPETRHTVYIRPANVKGNTLRVDMRYVPSPDAKLPLNHAKALEAMSIIPTYEGDGIRLTLPEQTPARVAIFDKKGKKLVKAVRYVSPMKIDVSDLKRGTYRMVVAYGPAVVERTFEIKK